MSRYFKLLTANETSIHNAWSLLINGVEKILTKNTISVSYEEMYRNAYFLSLHKLNEAIVERLEELIAQHLKKRVRVHLLSQFDENFLKSFNDAFSDHQKSVKVIGAVLNCSQQRIRNLQLTSFREQIINSHSICDHLRTVLFDTITRDRTGEEIDRSLIKNVCELLMDLEVYQEVFEKQFLSYSAEFYKNQSEKYLAANNVLVYLKTVKDFLKQESDRAMQYLNSSAAKNLHKTLEIEFIHKRMKNITGMNNFGIKYMLLNQQTDALTFVYNYFRQITNGLQMISQCAVSYLDEQGKELMENRHDKDGIKFIQSLMDLKDNYDQFLHRSFHNDKLFKDLFTNKFIYLFNSDPKHTQYLSSFIHNKIKVVKNTTVSQRETKVIVDKAVAFFKFIQEKDLFEKYYRRNLAKRLLRGESDLYAEDYVISKFKLECGFDYTSKLELMCNDINLSESLSAEFKRCVQSDKLDLNVYVLRADSWPMSCSKSNCVIPIAPMMAFDSFMQFYLSRHKGKLLNLLSHGWADLNAVFYGSGEDTREFTLQVSTYQMCVLMLFNNQEKLRFNEIKSETDIPEKDLVRALQSLAKGNQFQRVLNKFPESGKIEGNDIFNVNDSFISIERYVKIETVIPVTREFKKCKKTKIKDDENRKYDIEATIVRVMKSRRKMHHDDLIAVVTDQLKSRFLPDVKLVKNSIEALVERDYLARVKSDPKIYTYVA